MNQSTEPLMKKISTVGEEKFRLSSVQQSLLVRKKLINEANRKFVARKSENKMMPIRSLSHLNVKICGKNEFGAQGGSYVFLWPYFF